MSEMLPEEPVRVPLSSRLLVSLIVPTSKVLSRKPPQRLRQLLGRLSAGARPAGYAETKLARDQLLTASALCRGRSACLTRSLSVLLLCRTRGIWPTWCVGVLTASPFTAHAWVEADGRMVDEPVDSRYFCTLFTVPAGKVPPTSAIAANG